MKKLMFASIVTFLLAGVGPATAQIPDEFTNLQVAPKDIGKGELIGIMRSFAGALDVRCNHCHVGKGDGSLEGMDFASDELEPKKVARAMMKMTSEINSGLMPATGRKSPIQVRCETCHGGLMKPESLDRVVMRVIEEDGVEAAEKRYRELHAEHYGDGAYNFGAGTLNSVAETLAREKGDLDGAITVMKLNLDFNPDAAYSHLMIGQLYANTGDKEAATAAIERSLEIEPDNPYAKRMLEGVREME
jgi:tetratricopeptide (TPR) repeat protein